MIFKVLIPVILMFRFAECKIEYPKVRRDETVVDTYYGVNVQDPYRWLEDPDSEEVKQFITAQNKLTSDYVDLPIRAEIHQKLSEAIDYERYKVPQKQGPRYFFYKNTGRQNQDVLYVQDTLKSEPRVFLDPNKLSEDGTTSVHGLSFSNDGELLAYQLQEKGSDWVTIRVRNVSTGVDFPEVLAQVKFSGVEWTLDNKGFFYARYPSVTKGVSDGTDTDKVQNQKLYYHYVGTAQQDDVLVAEFPDHPNWILGDTVVTEEGNYLLILPSEGASGEVLVYYASIAEPIKSGFKSKLDIKPVISKFDAEYEYVTNDEAVIYFRTNKGAPNYKIVGIDLNRPGKEYWSTLVPEHSKRVLQWAFSVNRDKVVIGYLEDVKSRLELRFLGNGSFIQNFPLEIGTVNSFSAKRTHDEFFFNFVSFLTPGKVFRVDLTKEQPYVGEIFKQNISPGVEESKFVVKQIFYPSKDGTQIPMFIIHKKDYVPQKNSPTFIYAYGGFNVNILPSFVPERVFFVQHFDGVYAIPNIRGGGEYGQKWHQGGRLLKKQNVFDDFQAAAQYLIDNEYTVPSKIVINGGSNGGLLIGACVNQRPDLYGAGIAQVGVMDLLRFQKFTIGHAWCSEYGCSDDGDKSHFDNLLKLSPLHNVRIPKDESVQYPAVLLLTGDHDDRVVPLHSYKLAAELQHKIGALSRQTNPLLLKVTTSVGHGSGKPVSVKIAEVADIYTFLVKSVGFKFNP